MLSLILLLPVSALATSAAESDGNDGGTLIKVHRGTVLIEQDGKRTELKAGEEARLTGRGPVRVKGSQGKPPGPAKPIRVRWEPTQTVVMADEVGILLRKAAKGSEGQSVNGRYAARLSSEGELLVADLLHDRQAIRFTDGSWLHKFSDCELRIDPSGRTTMRMPDGRELTAAEPVAVAAKKADTTETKTPKQWKIGIHLDKTVTGLRVKSVSPESPAERAGFQPGDEVLAIGGLEAPSLAQIQQRLQKARPGEKISFAVQRKGETVVLTVVAGAWE
jgi:hypothetical protein